MVQVIPQVSLGGEIGRSLAQGMQQGSDIGFQRGVLENALKNVNNIPPELKNLIIGTTGLPEQGRILQAALPFVQNRLQAQQALGIGAQNQPALPGTQPPQMQGMAPSQQLPIPLPAPVEGLGAGFENLGLGIGAMPSTYSEQQYKDVNQQYLSSGLDPTPAINRMREQDQVARERFQDIEAAAGRQAEFTNYLREHNPKWSDADVAVGERFSLQPDIRNIKNDALKENQVRKKVELYQSAKDNLKKNSERRSYDTSEHNRQLNNLASYAKTMVDAGQRDEAEKMLAENGWGPVEIQSILNPLSPEITSGFSKLPKMKNILDQVTALPDTPKYEEQVSRAFQKNNSDLQKYKDYISNNFKTGVYDPVNVIKPGTSLLELRDESMKNGVTFQQFESIINDLLREGKIKLDQYQQKEHPLLAEHPARSFSIEEILWRLNPFYIPRK